MKNKTQLGKQGQSVKQGENLYIDGNIKLFLYQNK